MKTSGTILLVAGTVVATFGGARLPQADAVWSGLGLALLAAGGALHVLHRRMRATSVSRGAGGVPVFDLIRALPEQLQALLDDAGRLTLAEIAECLGGLQRSHFGPIAEASPTLMGAMGAERFAAVFGAYAGGERLIARAWSAAVDHHRPETLASLREGLARLHRAAAAIAGDDRPTAG